MAGPAAGAPPIIAGLGAAARFLGRHAVVNPARNLASSLNSAFTGGDLPPLDLGSMVGGAMQEAIRFQAASSVFKASFGQMTQMSKQFVESLNQIGYTRSNFLDTMRQISSASGQTGKALHEGAQGVLAFSRAYGIDPEALAGASRGIVRSGGAASASDAGGRLLSAGIGVTQLQETLDAMSQLSMQQMARGSGGEALYRGNEGIVNAITDMAGKLGDRKGAYMGENAVRMAAIVDQGAASRSALAMIANPWNGSESYNDYLARLETDRSVRSNMIKTARGLGGDVGATMLRNIGLSAQQSKDILSDSFNENNLTDDMSAKLSGTELMSRGIDNTPMALSMRAKFADTAATGAGQEMLETYKSFIESTKVFDSAASMFTEGVKIALDPAGVIGEMARQKLSNSLSDSYKGADEAMSSGDSTTKTRNTFHNFGQGFLHGTSTVYGATPEFQDRVQEAVSEYERTTHKKNIRTLRSPGHIYKSGTEADVEAVDGDETSIEQFQQIAKKHGLTHGTSADPGHVQLIESLQKATAAMNNAADSVRRAKGLADTTTIKRNK